MWGFCSFNLVRWIYRRPRLPGTPFVARLRDYNDFPILRFQRPLCTAQRAATQLIEHSFFEHIRLKGSNIGAVRGKNRSIRYLKNTSNVIEEAKHESIVTHGHRESTPLLRLRGVLQRLKNRVSYAAGHAPARIAIMVFVAATLVFTRLLCCPWPQQMALEPNFQMPYSPQYRR